jgi:hypothetical protein
VLLLEKLIVAQFRNIFSLLLHGVLDSPYKDKAIPLQSRTGPEDSRRLRLPDFKTVGTPAAFTLQEISLVLISIEAESTLES